VQKYVRGKKIMEKVGKTIKRCILVIYRNKKKSTFYNGASLRSPILEKGVTLGVSPDRDIGTWYQIL